MEAWTGGRAVVELLKVEGVNHRDPIDPDKFPTPAAAVRRPD
jgi:hypothetical protein